jgi:hypothetical protein
MKTLLRFLLLALGGAAVLGGLAQAQVPPMPPWGLGPQSATAIDVPSDVRRQVGSELDYEDAEPVRGIAVDLNGDGVRDYLLESAPRLCGNGGCVYVLYDGATRRKLGQFFGSPLYVRGERTHGALNIATYSHQSADSATYTEYGFDGKVYSVTSARTVDGPAADRLLETLRQIPIWRPRP